MLGISPDSAESHARFRARNGLNFPLLVDPGRDVARSYGAWKGRRVLGKEVGVMERSTFIIDEEGILQAVWRKVSVKGHARRVLEELQS